MTSEIVPHRVSFLKMKIDYIWQKGDFAHETWFQRRNLISGAGPHMWVVDPSSILENSTSLSPMFLAKNQ